MINVNIETRLLMYLLGCNRHLGLSYCTYGNQYQWPCGLRRGSKASRLLVLRVGIPPGARMSVSCECWVLSLWRADQSSRGVLPSVVYLVECDRGTSTLRRLWPTRGCWAIKNANRHIVVSHNTKTEICLLSLNLPNNVCRITPWKKRNIFFPHCSKPTKENYISDYTTKKRQVFIMKPS